ncbi:MAG: hypothetical protein R3E86_21765 [Pseudomonadales bacterium]
MSRARNSAGAVALASVMLLLGACESKLASLTDAELQDRIYQCSINQDQSPGFAISCDNYRRECQRRRDSGRYVC